MHSYACFLRSKTTVFSVLNLYEMHLEFHHPQQHMQNKGFQTFVLHIFSNKYIFSRYRLLISFSQDKNIVSLQDISMVNHLVKRMKECELVVLSLFLNFSFKSFFFFAFRPTCYCLQGCFPIFQKVLDVPIVLCAHDFKHWSLMEPWTLLQEFPWEPCQ